MGDTMLLGVLRMPMDNPDPVRLRQFVSRARQAADRIEADAKEIERLRREIESANDDGEAYAEIAGQEQDENERLREAVTRLLACPAIADENHSDPEWGCAETREAESFARAVLAEVK